MTISRLPVFFFVLTFFYSCGSIICFRPCLWPAFPRYSIRPYRGICELCRPIRYHIKYKIKKSLPTSSFTVGEPTIYVGIWQGWPYREFSFKSTRNARISTDGHTRIKHALLNWIILIFFLLTANSNRNCPWFFVQYFRYVRAGPHSTFCPRKLKNSTWNPVFFFF